MDRMPTVQQLRSDAPVIAPSMLKCNFANLEEDFRLLSSTSWIHWDCMDGRFVPNLSYGSMLIQSCQRVAPSHLAFEAHLMLQDPGKYLDGFIAANCEMITFHIEADGDAAAIAGRIREAGRLAGIAINPGTPVSAIASLKGHVDNVLVMSVEPGFGGQAFLPDVLPKLREARDTFGDDVCLSIDGGIGLETIEQAAAAGAEYFVCGSAIFDRSDCHDAIVALERTARKGHESVE